ncbi:FAD-binding protein [Candidatus Aerophobetes bacterium]|nr:FAD-binding protein [Candidatus Aerophobetes bacterium]
MLEELRAVVGDENVSDDAADRYVYGSDASMHQSSPSVVVRPASAGEIQKILRFANGRKIPVVPRGAGTGESGSAVPIDGGIVLDLKRMDRILEVRPEDMFCRVEPGVVNDELNRQLKPYGFFFPPTPASGKVCTIGGMIANNASGMRAMKYGATRDAVLGLKVVLANGDLVTMGSATIIQASGYQLERLMVGSEGTLGVIVEATLRVRPLPEERTVGRAVFYELTQAGDAISKIVATGIVPSALELMDEVAIKSVNKALGAGLPEVEALILFECDGVKASFHHEIKKIKRILEECGAFDIVISDDPQEMEKLWEVRSSVFPATSMYKENRIRATLAEDVTAPVSRLRELVEGIHQIARDNDLLIGTYGHAGEGLIHTAFLVDPRLPDEWDRTRKAVDEVFALVHRLGGTTSGEHGIGISKAPYFKKERQDLLELMRGVKKVFDPNNILNPHKLMDAPEDFFTATKLRYPIKERR